MKKIFALSFMSVGAFYTAQNIGNSPYAAYGIGDMKYDNTTENTAMAGMSTAYISDTNNSFNFMNPAANANLQLTSIKFEGSNENNYYSSNHNNYSGKKHTSHLSNLSIAFPISSKVKFGMGYQPYSSKGYSIASVDNNITHYLMGKGTVSTVQAAVSYKVNSSLSVGLRSNYYFGVISDLNEVTPHGAQYTNGRLVSNTIKNFNFTLGSVYQHSYEDDTKITVGATATLGNIGSSVTNYQNSSYIINNYGEYVNQSIIEQQQYDGKRLFPFEASIGAGYGHSLKWFLGSQVNYKSGYDTQFQGNNHPMQSGIRVAVGGWYLPNFNNFRNYLDRVTYRFGAFYDKTGLVVNGTQINEMGITLGAFFPFKNASINKMTGIDFAVEFGKRGTTQNNLINQNFINLKFGINFADRWFLKTVYN